MKARVITLTLLLAATIGWFAVEHREGKTREADEWFLDFLVANARDTLAKNMPAESPNVVLVEFREEDKQEYEAWPPAAGDYWKVMLKRLKDENDPFVLAIVEPLRWEKENPQSLAPLGKTLEKFTWVLLGFHLATDEAKATAEQEEFAHGMPILAAAEGDRKAVPKFSRVAEVTDKSLRPASDAGFSAINGVKTSGDAMPFVADDGKELVPSLAAQAATLFRRVPLTAQRLRFGTGARLSLGDTYIIPLRADGSLPLSDRPKVPAVNALELMTPDLGDETAKAVQATLGKGKVVVLGNGPDSMLHARAIATALAMPEIKQASALVSWVFAGMACLFCFWQLRCGRWKALISGVVALVVGMGFCLLAFQSSLVWWPPLAALLVMATGTVFCFLWPAKPPTHIATMEILPPE